MRPRQLSGRDVVAVLVSFGFQVVSIRGSHCKLRRQHGANRETLTIPLHASLAPGTVRAIYRQAIRFIPESALGPRLFHD